MIANRIFVGKQRFVDRKYRNKTDRMKPKKLTRLIGNHVNVLQVVTMVDKLGKL